MLKFLALMLGTTHMLAGHPDNLLITETAMIYAHDAATVGMGHSVVTKVVKGLIGTLFGPLYYAVSSVVGDKVIDYAKTQSGSSISDLLTCGARGFDLRVLLTSSGNLKTAHDYFKVEYTFEKIVQELKSWGASHQGDILIAALSCACRDHFYEGTHGNCQACWDKVNEVLTKEGLLANLNNWSSSTSKVNSPFRKMTVGDVKKLPSNLLLVKDWQSNYDDSQECYYKDNSGKHKCYGHSMLGWTVDGVPMNRLKTYVRKITDIVDVKTGLPDHEDKLWNTQAHWQYSGTSITAGTEFSSSIIKDEEGAQVNQRMNDMIPFLKHLNLLGLDNVCNHGNAIYQTMDARNNKNAALKSGGGRRLLEASN